MESRNDSHKIALVIDWLFRVRGAERVLDSLLEVYPGSDVFALFGDTKNLGEMKQLNPEKVKFSFLQKFPFIKKYYRYTYPLWPLAIESFDFKGYDLVISVSSSAAKGVVTPLGTPHISYLNTPMRYAWDMTFEYFTPKNFSWFKRLLIPFFLNYLRIWDVASTDRISYLVANSNFIADRVMKYYKRKVDTVIYPPVEPLEGKKGGKKADYYLYFGALEPNKGVKECVEAAVKYGFKLKVCGNGSLGNGLRKLAKGKSNVQFIENIKDNERKGLMAGAKALLFPSVEDFGIVAIEAMSVGTPVLGLDFGGTSETIVPGVTGVLIREQSSEAIWEGVRTLGKIRFDKDEMIKHVRQLSKKKFQSSMKKVIEGFLERKEAF